MAIALLLLLVPITTVVAVGMRFGGSAHFLNIVDYSQIADARWFNRWAGNRLLLPASCAACAAFAARNPDWTAPLLIAFMLVLVVIIWWVAIGAARFQRQNGTEQRRAQGSRKTMS